eukprot:CAMPEP_0171059568 /NCGR_PEP_ID=MMETSP0766_2-20121228/3253_1 /TAXON_ID=439317 /ORGANISM="Gambierdiscus australes, Strain CAWD 149" /LENGTH=159 /DNA_ID=CAMNT_0011515017 /DNA_START=140 /DNA_END=619 /DNA_ORIENTATION=+
MPNQMVASVATRAERPIPSSLKERDHVLGNCPPNGVIVELVVLVAQVHHLLHVGVIDGEASIDQLFPRAQRANWRLVSGWPSFQGVDIYDPFPQLLQGCCPSAWVLNVGHGLGHCPAARAKVQEEEVVAQSSEETNGQPLKVVWDVDFCVTLWGPNVVV